LIIILSLDNSLRSVAAGCGGNGKKRPARE